MKQIEFLTESGTARNLAKMSSSELLTLRETMRDCEAREWIARYRAKQKQAGRVAAWTWWQDTLADISKRRGEKAAEDLRQRMNRNINEKSGKS